MKLKVVGRLIIKGSRKVNCIFIYNDKNEQQRDPRNHIDNTENLTALKRGPR